MKRQHLEWEKILANNLSDKELISKIHKNSYNSIAKKKKKTQTIQFFKMGKDLNRSFCKGDMQMAIRYMKRCSTSPIIRKMQIKTTM